MEQENRVVYLQQEKKKTEGGFIGAGWGAADSGPASPYRGVTSKENTKGVHPIILNV